MKTYYPCTWISFVNKKIEKNKKLKFVIENYIYCSLATIIFETTDLYTIQLFSKYADN